MLARCSYTSRAAFRLALPARRATGGYSSFASPSPYLAHPSFRSAVPRRVSPLPRTVNQLRAMSQEIGNTGPSFLGQDDAVSLDEALMGPLGFSVEQLMELAGLSCACALSEVYAPTSHSRVLVICGPGNNGGDGLVAARHLHHFGYRVTLCYPKQTGKQLYANLVKQCESLCVPFIGAEEMLAAPLSGRFDVVMDAMFGFSFKGDPRPPFDSILAALKPAASPPALVSVDVPSGWQVEAGDVNGDGLRPDVLVSLTAPKLCAKGFTGAHHYVGGRFVPPEIRDKYALRLPPYPGTAQCVRIGGHGAPSLRDMSVSYTRGQLSEDDVAADAIDQFSAWLQVAKESAAIELPHAMTLATVGADGTPSARVMLLKGYSADGFVFYTDYNSRKGHELESNPAAAAVFFWETLQRSVRVEGRVSRVSSSENDEYFSSRPRNNQIGALASNQSTVLPDGRASLEAREAELKDEYSDSSRKVPRPEHWGGYRLVPSSIEFWQGRESRLHDRLKYVRDDKATSGWRLERLSP